MITYLSMSPLDGSFAPGYEPGPSDLEKLIAGRQREVPDLVHEATLKRLGGGKVDVLGQSFKENPMTKTDWTAEEVLAEAHRHGDHVADMLTAFAEMIERAVPVAEVCERPVHHDLHNSPMMKDVRFTGQPVPVGTKLFAYLPAQEQPGWKVPDAFVKLHEAASKGFHTSESCGPESLYMHKSQFPTLQDLFDFEDAWRKAMLAARAQYLANAQTVDIEAVRKVIATLRKCGWLEDANKLSQAIGDKT